MVIGLRPFNDSTWINEASSLEPQAIKRVLRSEIVDNEGSCHCFVLFHMILLLYIKSAYFFMYFIFDIWWWLLAGPIVHVLPLNDLIYDSSNIFNTCLNKRTVYNEHFAECLLWNSKITLANQNVKLWLYLYEIQTVQ